MPDTTTGVVVIGGGSTGAGVLRDLSMRGIDAVLVEKGDLASGTTGRSHGLLHSGGRYCVSDLAAAIECVEEGRILRRIARTTIEDTGGYFVSVSEEDEAWEPRFVEACGKAGITCERISVEEARRREPALSKHVRTVFWIPEDGHLDPFYLVMGNVESARRRGAQARTYTEVTGFIRDGNQLTGVLTRDTMTGEETSIGCKAVINATGAWAGFVARLLDVEVKVVPVKGVMVVLSHRVAHATINRCHKPGDGDIIVPALAAGGLGETWRCTPAGVPLNDRGEELDQFRHRPAQLGVPKPHGDERPLQPLVCECELVRPQDVAPWFEDAAVRALEDIRRRTRTGMGPCQAAICSYRLAGRLVTDRHQDGPTATRAMAELLQTRLRGVRPVFWGSQLRQAQVTAGIHLELFNLDRQLMLEKSAAPPGHFPPPQGEGQGGGVETAEVASQR